MSSNERIRAILQATAHGLSLYGSVSQGPERAPTLIASGLMNALAGLLKTRTPEEVKALIDDLAKNPAKKVDLEGIADAVDAVLAARRDANDESDD